MNKLYFDGASQGNPGKASCGFYIQYSGNSQNSENSENSENSGYKYLGPRFTNNEAEYQGLIHGLQECRGLGLCSLEVYGDSKLVIEQMNKKWKVKAPNLKILWKLANELLDPKCTYKFIWIPREQNSIADALANKALLF